MFNLPKPSIPDIRRALLVPIVAGLLSFSLRGADDPEGVDAPQAAEQPAAPVAPQPPAPPEPAAVPVEDLPTIDRGELVSIGSNSHLRSNETANEMVTIFGSAVADGSVWNEMVTIFGDATINGYVGNEVVCIMGHLTIGPNAQIRGDVVAVGGSVEIAPGAEINGDLNEIAGWGPLKVPSMRWFGEWVSDGLMKGRILPHEHAWAWKIAGVLLVLNILFALLFRSPLKACVSALDRKPAMSVVNGILLLLLYPVIVFILAVSVVGVFVIPFLAAGKFIAGILGVIAVYCYCGSQFGLRNQPILALIAGNLIFLGLYALPIVGLAVWILAGLIGTGCVLTALFDNMRSEADSPKPKPVAPAPVAGASIVAEAVPTTANPFHAAGAAAPETASASEPAAGAAPSQPAPGVAPSLPPGMLAADVYPRVGFWPRFGATALDFFLIAVLSAFLNLPSAVIPLLLIYHIAFWSWRATTLGGIILNLRIERIDGRKVGIDVAVIRALGCIFSAIIFFFGFFWASWDRERQAWHDKIAGTTIVRVPRGHSLI